MDRQQINRFRKSRSPGAPAPSLRAEAVKVAVQKQALNKRRFNFNNLKKLQQILQFNRYGRTGKLLYVVTALVLFFTAAFPAIEILYEKRAFRLSEKANALLDVPSKKLAQKITYNKENRTYHFNEKQKSVEPDTISDPAQVPQSVLQSQVTAKDGSERPLYSVDMPEQIEDGFTYYDNNLKVSFKMIPEGQTGKGVLVEDRLVYNVSNGTKAVFTVKNNGIKEDVILQKKPNYDELSLDYKLELPNTLEARLLDDGSLGIYSADPSLFGNITFGSDADREKVESARANGEKNYLVFNIPAPVVKESGSRQAASAKFLLAGSRLTVYTRGLQASNYPLSIDPSVIVTSTGDFTQGNKEDGIEYGANEIRRPGLTGGTLGPFITTSSMNDQRTPMDGVVYNGFLYAFGDWTNDRTSIEYAPILADGSVGAWILMANAMPQNRYGFGVTIYNGYVYIVCGNNGTHQQTTYYGKINADGSVDTSSWTLSPNIITGPRFWNSVTAYNGYLYSSGGRLDADGFDIDTYSQVWKTSVSGDGSIGVWSQTQAMPTNRALHDMEAYNGYMYVAGGQYWDNSPLGAANDVLVNNIIYTRINADGTLGSWQTATTIASAIHKDIFIYAGYAYWTTSGSVLAYAPIAPNGSLGTARQTSSPGGCVINSPGLVTYNGRIYCYGGGTSGTDVAITQYAVIDNPGITSSYSAGGAISARTGVASVAHDGYIYAIGGHDGTNPLAAVTRAQVGSNGIIGTWSTTGITQLATARAYAAATVYNGFVYVSGGINASNATINDVQYLSLANLAGAWSSATPGTARYKHAMVAYSGYLYIVGGDTAGPPGVNVVNTTRRATINLTNGSLGSWVDGASFVTERRGMGVAMLGNRMFMTGGYKNEIVGGTLFGSVQYTDIDPATGDMSAWTTLGAGNNLSTARSGLTMLAYNGCLYAVGGLTVQDGEVSTNNYSTTSVEYACQLSDGTLTSWSANTPLTDARVYMASAVVDGVLSVAGGSTHGTVTTPPNLGSASAEVHNGGSGTVGTAVTSPNTFATARQAAATAAYNGYIYVAGGNSATGNLDDVRKAPINADGTIGSWVVETNLSTGGNGVVVGSVMIAYSGYMYMVGGNWPSSNALVYSNTINPTTGALGPTWTAQPSLNTQRYYHGIALYNGYIYAVGGIVQQASVLPTATFTLTNTVEYAKINDNGSLSAWAYTTPIGVAKAHISVAAANGYLYFTGGASTTSVDVYHRQAYTSKINTDGTIDTWTQTSSLPFTHYTANQLEPYNGHMYYAYGGIMYRSTILSNGHLTDWRALVNTHASRTFAGVVAYKGFLYIAGGSNGSARQDNVQYLSINSIERRALYSRVLDVGMNADISSISYNSNNVPLNDHKRSIIFQTAAPGSAFGAKRFSDDIPAYLQNTCTLLQNIRYVHLSIIFDDSRNAGYPDAAAVGRQNLTEATVNYVKNPRPDTQSRMFQGKQFLDNTLRPYDTCQ